MTRLQRAKFVEERLALLYPNPKIPLLHKDPFTMLVAVMLSANSTDKSVNKVTPELFSFADTPEKMLTSSTEKILNTIRPVGLGPQKTKALQSMSQDLIDKFHGQVPDNFRDLESLAGVGHKTASVVMSQVFGYPAFAVDTHIHRLAYRWCLSTGKNVNKTETDLKRVFSPEKWNNLHLQIIYFGREYCPARGHNPVSCPICSQIGRKTMFK